MIVVFLFETLPLPTVLLRSSNSAQARKYGGVREWPVGRFAIYFLDFLVLLGQAKSTVKK
jgi:hypothetical protein